MEYKVESSLEQFQAWSGGKDTLETLIEKGDCDQVEALLEDYFGCSDSIPTDTDINDILWFERDWIAEGLGYRDWDAYEEGWSESDLSDAEDWFEESDFDTLGDIACISRGDYEDDEDGFCDAIQDWWDGLTDAKKVEIYYQND